MRTYRAVYVRCQREKRTLRIINQKIYEMIGDYGHLMRHEGKTRPPFLYYKYEPYILYFYLDRDDIWCRVSKLGHAEGHGPNCYGQISEDALKSELSDPLLFDKMVAIINAAKSDTLLGIIQRQ